MLDLNVEWIHGTPPIQAYRSSWNTWILRQSPCLHFEAPFMYLLCGRDRALLLDTGAKASATEFPLRNTVRRLLNQWKQEQSITTEFRLIVAHSHLHSDHVQGDGQFLGDGDTEVVGHSIQQTREIFGIAQWPDQNGTFDLGQRKLDILPIPGHDPTSIAIYDHATKMLLTGDSLYPGNLYVRDWTAYKKSIRKLRGWSENNEVSLVLGTHIEMSKIPGQTFRLGSRYHPNEHVLELTVEDLVSLDDILTALGDTAPPQPDIHEHFVIVPL